MTNKDDTRAHADEPSKPKRTPLEEAALQLELIAGEPDPRIAFRTIPENGEGRPSTSHGTLSVSWSRLEKAQLNGGGVFFTVNETDGAGAKASNIRKARASFIDLDGAPLPTDWPVQPHLVVETSPGRFHAYWMIKPEADLKAWSRMQSALAEKFDADPSVKDAPRVMRLAGFKHQKRDPFTSRIVSAASPEEVNSAWGKRIAMRDLATAMGVSINEEQKSKATSSLLDRPAAFVARSSTLRVRRRLRLKARTAIKPPSRSQLACMTWVSLSHAPSISCFSITTSGASHRGKPTT